MMSAVASMVLSPATVRTSARIAQAADAQPICGDRRFRTMACVSAYSTVCSGMSVRWEAAFRSRKKSLQRAYIRQDMRPDSVASSTGALHYPLDRCESDSPTHAGIAPSTTAICARHICFRAKIPRLLWKPPQLASRRVGEAPARIL